ncbi:hypothetical protein HanIR_Chr09g0398371 [Helianthus annuus]|nr:hypothetical protein HanIR_Chr09g0398371 [Helianthus annuus]
MPNRSSLSSSRTLAPLSLSDEETADHRWVVAAHENSSRIMRSRRTVVGPMAAAATGAPIHDSHSGYLHPCHLVVPRVWLTNLGQMLICRANQRSLGILDLENLLSGVAGVVMGRQEGFM